MNKKYLLQVVESLLKKDSDSASKYLSEYLSTKSKMIVNEIADSVKISVTNVGRINVDDLTDYKTDYEAKFNVPCQIVIPTSFIIFDSNYTMEEDIENLKNSGIIVNDRFTSMTVTCHMRMKAHLSRSSDDDDSYYVYLTEIDHEHLTIDELVTKDAFELMKQELESAIIKAYDGEKEIFGYLFDGYHDTY